MCNDDIEICANIFHRAFDHTQIFRDLCDCGKYFTGFIGNSERYAYCILNDNEVIGFITALNIPNYIYSYTVFIDCVAVDTDFQRRGYGSEALDRFLNLFSEDVNKMLVTEKKRPAYKMYEKSGFIEMESCIMENSSLYKIYKARNEELKAQNEELKAQNEELKGRLKKCRSEE